MTGEMEKSGNEKLSATELDRQPGPHQGGMKILEVFGKMLCVSDETF